MQSRYQVVSTPDLKRYAIYDKQLDALCALLDGTPGLNLLPLEWDDREMAEEWLIRCRSAWRANSVPVPHRWDSWRPAAESPWTHYTSPDPEGRLTGPAPMFRPKRPV